MPLEPQKCLNCGALRAVGGAACAVCGEARRGPDPGLAQAVIARPVVPPPGARGGRATPGPGYRFRKRQGGGTSGPPRVRVAMGRGEAPITLPPGKVGGVFRRRAFERDVEKLHSFGWSDAEIVELAGRTLGSSDGLHFAPSIPSAKVATARAVHGDALGDDAQVLVLFRDTLFADADDGFSITARAFFWKNLGDEPLCLGWDEIDPEQVTYDDDEHRIGIMGDDLTLTSTDAEALAPRLHDLIVTLASLAQDEDDP